MPLLTSEYIACSNLYLKFFTHLYYYLSLNHLMSYHHQFNTGASPLPPRVIGGSKIQFTVVNGNTVRAIGRSHFAPRSQISGEFSGQSTDVTVSSFDCYIVERRNGSCTSLHLHSIIICSSSNH